MGFSISSPGMQHLERAMTKADLGKVIWTAAAQVCHDHGLIDKLHRSAKEAGASRDLLGDIGLYLDDRGQAVVGIPGGPTGQEAHELEYGTAVGAPAGWMRATMAQHKHAMRDAFSRELFAALMRSAK